MTHFDIFTIRQWQEGYTLHVDIARPNNAPRFKRTKADRDRTVVASEMNYKHLANRMFPTLEAVMEEINKLKYPEQLK